MSTRVPLHNASRFLLARVLCGFSLALCVVSFAAVTGCGSQKGPKSSVSGKVTYKGENVAGMVSFVGPDNKEVPSPIKGDGTYQVDDPPIGQVKVVVKGMLGGTVPGVQKGGPTGGELPSMPGMAKGANPPAKYGSADKTPLSTEIKPGKQTYDITLTD